MKCPLPNTTIASVLRAIAGSLFHKLFLYGLPTYVEVPSAVSRVLSGVSVSSHYIEQMHLINKNKFITDIKAPLLRYRSKDYKPNTQV